VVDEAAEEDSAGCIERNPILRELSCMMAVLPLVLLLSLQGAKTDAKTQEPLLVVVEASAGEVVKVAALRDAIAHELGGRVLSPAEDEPEDGVAIMTVVLAPDKAVVVFRREGGTIRRAIQLPPDGRQRLQLVTWLAGNVVRDQTVELLRKQDDDTPEEKTSVAAMEGPPEKPAEAAPPPPVPPSPMPLPPTASPAGPPKTTSPPPAAGPVPVVVVATNAAPRIVAPRKQWTLAALYGQGFLDTNDITCNCGPIWNTDVGRQSEFEVSRSGPSFAIGGTFLNVRGHAGGLTLGWHRQVRPWLVPEVGATAGLWSMKNMGFEDSTDLFLRLAAGLSFSPTSWLDVLARLSVISPMSRNVYLFHVAVGLRYRLPL
jgi:hypothetical protein